MKDPLPPGIEPIPCSMATDEDDMIFANMLIVRVAIRDKHPPSNVFVQDTMPCPICKKGTVSYVISDHYNGHIHAHCNTEGCVSFME